MISKFTILAIFACLAVTEGARLSFDTNTNLSPVEKEGRLIDIPILGTVILKSLKLAWLLITTAFSLVGYKLAALALVANLVFWSFKNCYKVIIGAVAMFGFCKLTGKCSLPSLPQEFVEVGEDLVYAYRSLEGGETKYGDKSD